MIIIPARLNSSRFANKILDIVDITKKYARGYLNFLEPLWKYARFLQLTENLWLVWLIFWDLEN